MCIDARKTSLTGVQNSKKNRLAATRLVDDAPPWKKARSAAGMWGKNVFFFVMLLPRGKILISSAKYWFLGMRILKSSNTTWQLWRCMAALDWYYFFLLTKLQLCVYCRIITIDCWIVSVLWCFMIFFSPDHQQIPRWDETTVWATQRQRIPHER